jgi:hypothetical protein
MATSSGETAILRGPSFTDASGQVVLTLDASYSQQHEFAAEVTEHPVEQGIDVADHVRRLPITLRIDGVVSAYRLADKAADPYREIAAWALLEGMIGEVFEVATTLRVYPSMVLLRASTVREAGQGGDLLPSLELREIRTVQQVNVTLPPEIIRKTPQKATAPKKQDLGKQPTDSPDTAKGTATTRTLLKYLTDFAGVTTP